MSDNSNGGFEQHLDSGSDYSVYDDDGYTALMNERHPDGVCPMCDGTGEVDERDPRYNLIVRILESTDDEVQRVIATGQLPRR